jgi:hypothetical protein
VGGDRGRKLAWIAGWAGLLVLTLPASLIKHQASAGATFGYYVGGVLIAFGVGFVICAVFIKLARAKEPLWTPYVMACACGVAVLGLLGRIDYGGASGSRGKAADALLRCEGPPPASYFAGLPKRFVAVPDPGGEAEFRQAMREVGTHPELAARTIRSRGEFVAEAVVIDVGKGRDAIARGFLEEAKRNATEPPRTIPVGDGQGTLVKATLQGVDIVYVWGFTGCNGVVVFGRKVDKSRQVADALARGAG